MFTANLAEELRDPRGSRCEPGVSTPWIDLSNEELDPLQHVIALSFGQGNRDNRPRAEELTLCELIERFSKPDTTRSALSSAEYHQLDKSIAAEKRQRDDAKNGEYFVPCTFVGDGGRNTENIVRLSAFVLDFDSGETTREVIESALAGTFFVAYTSFSHRPEHPRWRVVIPYSKPIDVNRHLLVYERFRELFQGDLDPACKKPAQLYYTPACPFDAVHEFESFHAEGALFDPFSIPDPAGGMADTQVLKAGSAHTATEVDEALLSEALSYLGADDRAQWIDVGLAIKRTYGEAGLPGWLQWSQQSPKFDAAEAARTWQTLKPASGAGGITLATVFYRARQAGWTGRVPLDVDPHIAEMNEQFFVAPYGSKVPVFKEFRDPRTGHRVVEPMQKRDLAILLANRQVQVGDAGKPRMVPLLDYWLKHPDRREYEGVVFAPGGDVPGYFNLWQGFAVQPVPGSWEKFKRHLLNAVCRGQRWHYRYLLRWMAFAVQHPERPAEVAVVLKGGRGVGKGMVGRTLADFFGPHSHHISSPRHLTGNFNAHLESCVFLFVDEGHWAGDKAGEGVLKQLITEPRITIERKHFDAVMAENCLHILIASNNEWVVPAGPDERRFFVLEVDDQHQQDQQYFKELHAELDAGGREAMLYDLQRLNLKHFNIRKPPKSRALGEQKLHSMDSAAKWWLDKLVAGEFVDRSVFAGAPIPWGAVPKSIVHDDFVESVRKSGPTRRATESELGRLLRKLLPPGSLQTRRSTHPATGRQVPEYVLPSLADSRSHFEKLMRLEGEIDWSTGDLLN